MKYVRILSEFYGRVWGLEEELLLRMKALLLAQASGEKWEDEEIQNRIAAANAANGYERRDHFGFSYSALSPIARSENRYRRQGGSVAIIPIIGMIAHRMNLVSSVSGPGGGTSIQMLQAQLREALGNAGCRAIVLDVDSPGGAADCVPELAAEIYDARKQKPIIAVCNSMACSAAYWLACAASEVVCTPSGHCGSIGVYVIHEDDSEALKKAGIKITIIKAGKYKIEGNSAEPLSREAQDAAQGRVDDIYRLFVNAVARCRGVSQRAVREGYGQGRSLLAADAVKQGLADRVASLDDVLSELGIDRRRMSSGRGGQVLENGSEALAPRRRLALNAWTKALRAAPPNDDEEDEQNNCGCTCSACKACAGSRAGDGDVGCVCACNACKACDYKNRSTASTALARRQRELDWESVSVTGVPARGHAQLSGNRQDNGNQTLERRRRELWMAANGGQVSRNSSVGSEDWKQSQRRRQRQIDMCL
jgi:signal peptide peptidase SppA